MAELRQWDRRKARAVELGLVIPDPSVMWKAVQTVAMAAVNNNQEMSFRAQHTRMTSRIDGATIGPMVDYMFSYLMAELQQVALIEEKDKPKAAAVKTNTPNTPKADGKPKHGGPAVADKTTPPVTERGRKGGRKGEGREAY